MLLVIFKFQITKKLTFTLISKGNTVFFRKKYFITGKMDSLLKPRNVTSLNGSYYQAIGSSVSQNIISYLKMFSMQYRKNTTVIKMTKKNEYS